MTNLEVVESSNNVEQHTNVQDSGRRRESLSSQNSQTAKDFIESQLQLEADAREILPYSFDSCTNPLGPLRQSLFACITCNPVPATPDEPYTAAAVCYSCSIACHGEHTLVELFNKRNFVCDCGTTRLPPSAPCTLRNDPKTGAKGVHSEEPAPGNKYNHNFQNKFCGCGEVYDAHNEKGTMFQCLGLGTAETGGCGEDWWHPECLIGLPRGWNKTAAEKETTGNAETTEQSKTGNGENAQEEEEEEEEEETLPPGFPGEDDFETFICYKCLDSNDWLKRYAGTPGFLAPVYKDGGLRTKPREEAGKPSAEAPVPKPEEEQQPTNPRKRKAPEDPKVEDEQSSKRTKAEATEETTTKTTTTASSEIKEQEEAQPAKPDPQPNKHDSLPPSAPSGIFSLFLKEDFRDHLCRCAECYPNLASHPQLREEEETYEPPLSEDGHEANGGGSNGTGSLLDRGEAALSNVDRVRAIEGVMVYNHLRDKVKEFLKPFAESGTPVGAEDIKAYFEKLRGDEQGIRDAAGHASTSANGRDGDGGNGEDNRREQSGY